MKNIKPWIFTGFIFFIYCYSDSALAEITDRDLFENVIVRYRDAAQGWLQVIVGYASRLFWTLVLISMVWTFGFMALRKADIAEFFAEFLKFTITTGFFWWLLTNGSDIAESIIGSLQKIGGEATGLDPALTPSGVADIGFAIFDKVIKNSTWSSPVVSAIGVLLAIVILVIMALVAANMLVLMVSAWVLLYAGVFILGLGGSRWTSDIAITYYKTVLGLAIKLYGMILLIGIGASILDQYYADMSGSVRLNELVVILVFSLVLYILIEKVPDMIAGIITGGGIGSIGTGGGGAFMAAAAGGVAAGAAAATAAIDSARGMAGGAQAIQAACKLAEQRGESGIGSVTSILRDAAKSVGSDHIRDSTLGGKMGDTINAQRKAESEEAEKSRVAQENDNPSFGGDGIGAGAAADDSAPVFHTGDEVVDAFINKKQSDDSYY